MILQAKENKGVELTGYVCKGSGVMECGRRGVSGEKSTPARLKPSCVSHPGKAKGYCSLAYSALAAMRRSEEHTSELQSQFHLVCRLLLEKKKKIKIHLYIKKKKKKKKKT